MDKYTSKCKFISFGKCNKKYLLLFLGSFISNIIFNYLIVLLMNYDIIIRNNYINFMSYLFFINLGESMMIIPYLILKKNMNISSKTNNDSLIKKEQNNIEKYIFNKITIQFSKRDKIYIIIFGILKLILDTMYAFSIFFGNKKKSQQMLITNYSYNFEFIFLFLVSKFLFNTKFYRHQNVSIIVLILIFLGKFIFYFYNIEIGKIFLLLLFYIIYSFLKSLWFCYIKGLMEYKYFSPYKVCYIFGIFNLIILTPAFIIMSFISCETNYCTVEYNGKNYFGNIVLIFTLPGLLLFFISLIKEVFTILIYLIIQDFSVCHPYLLINITDLILIMIATYDIYYKVYIIVVVLVIGNFMILIYLEIIEINICGISHNSKRNIEERSISESECFEFNDDEGSSNQEDEEGLLSQTDLN